MNYKKKPNFLIVGAAKSGTTSIFNYLREHPDIYLPDRKECGFFSNLFHKNLKGPGSDYIKKDAILTFDEYMKKCFKNGDLEEKAIGEASTDYLYYYSDAIYNIKKYLGNDVKIIIILRNPLEAIISRYKHNLRREWESLSLEEAIEKENERISNDWLWDFHYIKSFSYSRQVESYINNFKSVHIILYDELKNNPLQVIKDIFRFLNIDSNFNPDTSVKYNLGGMPRFKMLYKFLHEENLFKNILKTILPKKSLSVLRKKKLILEKLLLTEINLDEKELKRIIYPHIKMDIEKLEKILDRELTEWKLKE